MARHTSTWIALAACGLFVPWIAGHAYDLPAAQDDAIAAAIDRLATDKWHPWEREPAWLELRRQLNEELTRRPDGPLAASARRAAALVDIDITPVVARRSEEASLQLDLHPRFQLDVPIPYVVEIYASLDGGEWLRIGVFRDGHGCTAKLTTLSIWPTKLGDGLHHLDIVSDISFLRTPHRGPDVPECAFPQRGRAVALPDVGAQEIIQREHRALSGLSFGIFPGLLGAPIALADSLEAGLPPVPITQWLNEVLASMPLTSPLSEASWLPGFCEPEESVVFVGMTGGSWRNPQAARRRSRAICMTLLAQGVDDRVLSLRLRVGTVNEDTGDWSIEPPSIRDISIGGSGNVLDVPFLSMLPSVVTLPAGEFPTLDVSIQPWDIRYEPADAKPGDAITITATIRNLGDRDAPFTDGMLAVKNCCESSIPLLDFVEDIPARGTLIVSLRTTMPRWGWAAVNIAERPANAEMRHSPYLYLRDVNIENNEAFIEMGTRPPGAVGP